MGAARRRPLRRAGLLALLVAGGSSCMSLDDLIFLPDRHVPEPPPGVEERWLTADDGVRVHAWYAAPARPAPVLLWSHGNGGNIAGRAGVLQALVARDVAVLAYDYRGYGRSEGRPSEAGVYRDARAAYVDEVARGTPAERLVAFGESLGGAVAVHLAGERRVAGVVLVSTFTTMRDVARHHYGPLGLLAGDRFDSRARVATLGVPLLVAHGDADDVVPFVLGERLFAAAREPKRFFRAAGFGHNDVFAAPGLLDAIAGFAHEVTGGRR